MYMYVCTLYCTNTLHMHTVYMCTCCIYKATRKWIQLNIKLSTQRRYVNMYVCSYYTNFYTFSKSLAVTARTHAPICWQHHVPPRHAYSTASMLVAGWNVWLSSPSPCCTTWRSLWSRHAAKQSPAPHVSTHSLPSNLLGACTWSPPSSPKIF